MSALADVLTKVPKSGGKPQRRNVSLPIDTANKLKAASNVLPRKAGRKITLSEIADTACLEWLARNDAKIHEGMKTFLNRMSKVLTS